MKKLLAILLAMMLAMISVAAFAADTTYQVGTTYTLAATAQQTIVIPKVYTVTSTVKDAKLPSDKIEFVQKAKKVENSTTITEAPDLVSISAVTITEATNGGPVDGKYSYNINIVLPKFTGVGVYTYTLEEKDNNIAGVTYIGDIVMKVTVVQNGNALQIAGIAFRKIANATSTDPSTKIDTFDNLYKAGSLSVTKTVSGLMGDQNKPFPITVVFTAPSVTVNETTTYKTVAGTISYSGDVEGTVAPSAWTNNTATVKFNLKHNQKVTFDNIPEGVTYTVIEDSDIVHLTEANQMTVANQNNPNAYLVAGEVKADANATITGGATANVTISNTKNVEVDTGVTLETSAYMLIMALALAGFVMLALRRREEY